MQASARTLGMQELVRAEASTELMRVITQSYRSERKKRLVTGFFAAASVLSSATLKMPSDM